MIMDKLPATGGFRCAELVNNHLVSRVYFGYTATEVKELFRQLVDGVRAATQQVRSTN